MKTKRSHTFTCSDVHEKERRSLAILELIRQKGPMARTDISKAIGVNVVSVSNYIGSFIEKNLVLEKGLAPSSGGRKPELIELNSKDNHCIGVDICLDGISVIVVDLGMSVVVKKKSARPASNREVPAAIIALIEDAAGSSGIDVKNLKAIGIGVCQDKLLQVRDDIEKRFGVDTFVGGAASCGAYAEKRFNSACGSGKLLYMYTDLGRGVFIEDDLPVGCIGIMGQMQNAGSAPEDASAQAYAEKIRYLNPWSKYLGIVDTARREVSRGVGTRIVSLSGGDVDGITEDVVIEAARQKDETALNIIQSVSVNLGLRTAYLINLFGPDVVVVAGGPEKASDMTFPPIMKMVERLSMKKYNRSVKMMPSGLGEEGLCLGAAALAVREVFLKA